MFAGVAGMLERWWSRLVLSDVCVCDVCRALPSMRGLDMSVVSREAPTLALAEEQHVQTAEQRRLDRLAKLLP